MTKEEIISGNEEIARFLGQHKYGDYYDVPNHEYPDAGSFWEDATDIVYHKSNLLYHYHWDWLEEAINKIAEIDPEFKRPRCDYDIKAAFSDVVEFIRATVNQVCS